jgi:hypothetical protein
MRDRETPSPRTAKWPLLALKYIEGAIVETMKRMTNEKLKAVV